MSLDHLSEDDKSLQTDWTLVLADDLTGALEAGAKFADYGLRATVSTQFDAALLRNEVVVIDTETRHLPPESAAVIVEAVCLQVRQFAPSLILKKTDSTLRGNIRAELAALTTSFPGKTLAYVPAYPDMGRSVRNGILFLGNIPVHQSEFARDSLNPVITSEIREIVGDLAIEIIDGHTNEHVQYAARSIVSEPMPRLCAGPAALAEALAGLSSVSVRRAPFLEPSGNVLVVNGSCHPAATAQIEWARSRGLLGAKGRWQLFNPSLTGVGLHRARALGEAVRRRIVDGDIDVLLVFGGDTAFAIHQAMEAGDFELSGELLPGVPTATCGTLRWITKAGGFGPPDLIESLDKLLWLSSNRSE